MKNQEIERKFLVKGEEYREAAFRKERIRQGFLSSVPERTVRIRQVDDKGWITVKGLGNGSGTTRFEWEKGISGDEAEQLLKICEPGFIYKTRYYVQNGDHILEVDEFEGENNGLVLAEIELSKESENFLKPAWLGEEVTGLTEYYNASLSQHPFTRW